MKAQAYPWTSWVMLGNIPAPCTHQAALPHKHCAGACSVCSLCQALLHKDRALRSSYPCITLSTATYKPAWKCQACSIFRDNYPELFGHHDGTMVQFMWKADLHGVATYVTDCLGVCHATDPERGRASDQPWVAGKNVVFLSLSLSL